MEKNYMVNAKEVAQELGISLPHAYKIIRQLNEELQKAGYVVVSGKIPKAFWDKKFYGYSDVSESA